MAARSRKPTSAEIKRRAEEAVAELSPLLARLDRTSCQINLVKSARNPSLKNTRHLDITTTLAKHFKAAAETSLRGIVAGIEADGLGRFNFDSLSGGRIAAILVDQFSEASEWLDQFPAPDAVSPLGANDNHISQLQFSEAILTFAPEGKKIRIFRKGSDAHAIKRSGIIARLTSGNKYEFVDPAETVVFDMLIDFLIWEDIVYVVNYKRFESILDFRRVTRSVATAAFDQFVGALPVSNVGELREVLFSGARYPNKLAALHATTHIGKLTFDRVRVIIAKRKLPISVVSVAGVDTLQIDASNKEHVKAYLHILSDDYVRSDLTDIEYISTEKT